MEQHQPIDIKQDILAKYEWYDASKIKEHQLCPQRYAFRYEEHILPNGHHATELVFGTAYHSALECFYTEDYLSLAACPHEDDGQDPETCCWCSQREGDLKGKIPLMYVRFLERFRKSDEDDKRTQMIGLQMLKHYVMIYGKGENFTVEAVEQTFVVPFWKCVDIMTGHVDPPADLPEYTRYRHDGSDTLVEQIDFIYVGKIDLIIRDIMQTLMPLDHKTTSRFGEMFEGMFRLDIQITGYIKALRDLTGEDVRRGVINAGRVSKKIDTDSFLRKMTDRYDEDLVRWEMDVRDVISQIRRSRETGHWQLHDYACYAYMRQCPYRPLCTSPSRVRAELKDQLYYRLEWKPL